MTILTILFLIRDLFPIQTNHNIILREMKPSHFLSVSFSRFQPLNFSTRGLIIPYAQVSVLLLLWLLDSDIYVLGKFSFSPIKLHHKFYNFQGRMIVSRSKELCCHWGCLPSYLSFLCYHYDVIPKDTV